MHIRGVRRVENQNIENGTYRAMFPQTHFQQLIQCQNTFQHPTRMKQHLRIHPSGNRPVEVEKGEKDEGEKRKSK